MYDYRQNWMTQNPDTIKHNRCNFRKEKKHLGQISSVGTMSKAKNLEISQFSFQGKWLLLWLL